MLGHKFYYILTVLITTTPENRHHITAEIRTVQKRVIKKRNLLENKTSSEIDLLNIVIYAL